MLDAKAALLIVDVQNDFCADGALAVPGAERILPVLNQTIDLFNDAGASIYASRDWHPAVTSHFREFGGRWPVHCVAGSPGAELNPQLHLPENALIVSKGQSGKDDGYSAFDGVLSDGSGLAESLRQHSISHLYIAGLATDYCVRASTLDALDEGFEVILLSDAIAGIDEVHSQEAIETLQERGALLAETAQLTA